MSPLPDPLDAIDRTVRTPDEDLPTAPVSQVQLPPDRLARGTARSLGTASPPPIPTHALRRSRRAPALPPPFVVPLPPPPERASRVVREAGSTAVGVQRVAPRRVAAAPGTGVPAMDRPTRLDRDRLLVLVALLVAGFTIGVVAGRATASPSGRAGFLTPHASAGGHPCV